MYTKITWVVTWQSYTNEIVISAHQLSLKQFVWCQNSHVTNFLTNQRFAISMITAVTWVVTWLQSTNTIVISIHQLSRDLFKPIREPQFQRSKQSSTDGHVTTVFCLSVNYATAMHVARCFLYKISHVTMTRDLHMTNGNQSKHCNRSASKHEALERFLVDYPMNTWHPGVYHVCWMGQWDSLLQDDVAGPLLLTLNYSHLVLQCDLYFEVPERRRFFNASV